MVVPRRKIRKSPTIADDVVRYVIDHDMGFAPNPFHGYCTLATCKPVIRKCSKIGDYILGFGSAKSKIRYRLIYWMQVEEISNFGSYWNDNRFQLKKPVVNGSHLKFHGDNIYNSDGSGSFVQAHSFHSLPSGEKNQKNFVTDTSKTDRVLLSQTFGYYGADALELPADLRHLAASGRPSPRYLDRQDRNRIVEWLINETERGFVGEPSGWSKIKE